MTVVWGMIAVWVIFNLLAPWSLLARAVPFSMGRVPPELVAEARRLRVRLFTAELARPGAFSVWAPPCSTLVVFDRAALAATPAGALRFLIAHELGHCAQGHVRERWLLVVTGAVLLPWARRRLVAMEGEADRYAERLTGIPAETFYSPKELNA